MFTFSLAKTASIKTIAGEGKVPNGEVAFHSLLLINERSPQSLGNGL